MIQCPDCEGRGGWLETVPVSGEWIDADQREVDCDTCDGTGEIEGEE